MDVTYEWSDAQTQNLYHCVCHELRNGLLGKLFFLLLCITINKVEIHEETLIANNCFDIIWIFSHNLQCWKKEPTLKTWVSSYFPSVKSSNFFAWYAKGIQEQGLERSYGLFFKICNFFPMYFNDLYWKTCIALLCSVWSHIDYAFNHTTAW